MQNKCIRCFIAGGVQGVGYRLSTQDQAVKLGLTGWVRNLPDGRVEALICGEKEKIMQLYTWLQRGPELAKVSEVTYEEVSWQEHPYFVVKKGE